MVIEISDDKITFEDVKEYETLFTMAPTLLLDTMIRRNSNLVLKFKPIIKTYMDSLTEEQRNKLEIILKTDTIELQSIMKESYQKTNKKQFKSLSTPQSKEFIDKNLNELRKMI